MTPHALLFTFAAIGISETVYLLRMRITQKKPTCVVGGACHSVLESAYKKTLGIPNDVLGLAFYVMVSAITAFLVIGVGPVVLWDLLATVFIISGVFMSFYFTYLQWRVIKVWCFWCLMSAMTIFAMGAIILTAELIV